jgi:hypothetical protein
MIRPLLLTLVIFSSGLYFACQSKKKLSSVSKPLTIEMTKASTKTKELSVIEQNCIKCHGPDKQKGKVRLDQLHDGVITREKMALIKESIALIKEGEMPPEKEATLTDGQKEKIQLEFTTILDKNTEASRQENQTVYRRLNNQEYLNSVSQLFDFDPKVFNPTSHFPADQRDEGINKIGSELISTKFLTQEYLQAANQIVDKMVRFDKAQKPKKYILDYKQLSTNLKDNNSAILYGSFHSGDKTQGCEIYLKKFTASEDGYYKFKIKATAKNRVHDLPKKIVYNDQEEPLRLGLKTGHFSNANMHAVFDLADGEASYECKIWLNKDESPQLVYPNAIYSAHNYRFNLAKIPDIHSRLGIPKDEVLGKLTNGYNKDRGHVYHNIYEVVKKLKLPKIHVSEVQVEGPFYESWNPDHQNLVFNGQKIRNSTWKNVLKNFATRAFRRPVSDETMKPYYQLVENQLSQELQFSESLKTALKAILCSPRFLFIQEQKQALDQYEIASRLSYFLWSSMPDKELFQAAKNKQLQSQEQILSQVDRMLTDKKALSFVKNFTSSWLQLYALGGILPHSKNFKDFYYMNIQESIKKETFLFFEYVLKNNRSVIDFLDSNYSILDRRLAKLYKLPAPNMKNTLAANDYNGKAPSTGFVKYDFKDERRGGLMGQASVLTVSANGVDTSPVIRGVWILEKLLCSPPPPAPAGVAAIEPDTRGAKSIKERLKKHQNDPNCSSCHKKIDPIGFALENYNPVGQWRDRYQRRQKVDASGEMDGQKFANIIGLKKALLEHSDDFAEAFAEKMLAYAIGRTPTFLDEQQLLSLRTDFKKHNYQLKDLIRLICTNSLFIQK